MVSLYQSIGRVSMSVREFMLRKKTGRTLHPTGKGVKG